MRTEYLVLEVLNLSEKSENLQQMVDLLKQGATLTELSCPACASPLFRFRNSELWCAKCEKRVIVVREDAEAEKAKSNANLMALENTLMMKIEKLKQKIRDEENVDELQKLSAALASFLENLEKLKKMKVA